MKLSKRVNYTLLLSLVLFSITLLYWTFLRIGYPNEGRGDSFFLHQLAGSMASEGYAKWILSPLSYFGLYPLSYPTGYPALLGSTMLLFGIDGYYGILFLNLFFTIISLLFVFITARSFKREDDTFALLVVLIFAMVPELVKGNLWYASARMMFTVLLVPILFSMFMLMDTKRKGHIVIVSLLFILCMTTHRMGVLLFPLVLAFVLTLAYTPIRMAFLKRMWALGIEPSKKSSGRAKSVIMAGAFLALFSLQFLPIDFYNRAWVNFEGSRWFYGDKTVIGYIANMAFDWGKGVGALIIFAAIGLFMLILAKERTNKDRFILLLFLLITPFMALTFLYLYPFLLPALAIIIGVGLVIFLSSFKHNFARISVLIVLIIVSTQLTGAFIDFGIPIEDLPVNEKTYETAMYVRYQERRPFVSDSGFNGGAVSALSDGLPHLPTGGATTPYNSAQDLAFDYVNVDDMNVEYINFMEINVGTDQLLYSNVNTKNEWASIMQGNLSNTYIEKYGAELLMGNPSSLEYTTFSKNYHSRLKGQVFDERYKIYDNNIGIWHLGAW